MEFGRYVSSLICRPSYQREINEINKLLKYYAGIYHFTYIDNGAITEDHLWKDGVHLNTRGMYELANIYASHLNRPHILPFESIWD